MSKIAIVKFSTLGAVPHAPWDAAFLIRVKNRLDELGLEETPDNVRETTALMRGEAEERVRLARGKRQQSEALLIEARTLEAEAEEMTAEKTSVISRRIGL
jgi:hypothetical protein